LFKFLSGHTTNWTAGAFGLRLFFGSVLRTVRNAMRTASAEDAEGCTVQPGVRNSLHVIPIFFEDALVSA
jgi:hypothetical protein